MNAPTRLELDPGLRWFLEAAREPDVETAQAARERQARLTKPAGSLGQLEVLAIRLAGLQGRDRPQLDRVHIAIFAGDHGVATEDVSAFPQAVTAEMIRNFARGGAAICVLARALEATLEIIDLGTVAEADFGPTVRSQPLGRGTANMTAEAAMSRAQLIGALKAGRDSVERARDGGVELYIGGEMGIANTTAATALACALLGAAPAGIVGPGTGVDLAGLERKRVAVERALARHADALDDTTEALRCLGGFEIAALVGAYLACARLAVPVLVDGFIASVAALAACEMNPSAIDWLLFAHRSAEPGHSAVLAAMKADPLLDLGMRLGEGSGAATAVPLLRLACALHREMATFAEAAISERIA